MRVQPSTLVDNGWPVVWGINDAGDSVFVTWPTATTGVRLRLAVHADSLVGRAYTFSQTSAAAVPTAIAVAHPVACEHAQTPIGQPPLNARCC